MIERLCEFASTSFLLVRALSDLPLVPFCSPVHLGLQVGEGQVNCPRPCSEMKTGSEEGNKMAKEMFMKVSPRLLGTNEGDTLTRF